MGEVVQAVDYLIRSMPEHHSSDAMNFRYRMRLPGRCLSYELFLASSLAGDAAVPLVCLPLKFLSYDLRRSIDSSSGSVRVTGLGEQGYRSLCSR